MVARVTRGSSLTILPRQGDVSPKVTEGEERTTVDIAYLPLRLASASHLPLAGEDRRERQLSRKRTESVTVTSFSPGAICVLSLAIDARAIMNIGCAGPPAS